VTERTRRHLIVHGLVQGVFFRDMTRRTAEAAGASGWVRNLRDGTVEAVVEGTPAAVDAVVRFCRIGPPGSRVDRVDVTDEQAEGLTGFTVEPTPLREQTRRHDVSTGGTRDHVEEDGAP
jgi:acylphosphatase